MKRGNAIISAEYNTFEVTAKVTKERASDDRSRIPIITGLLIVNIKELV